MNANDATPIDISSEQSRTYSYGDGARITIADLRLRFTIKEPSGTVMVPASDKREAVNAVASDVGSLQEITV